MPQSDNHAQSGDGSGKTTPQAAPAKTVDASNSDNGKAGTPAPKPPAQPGASGNQAKPSDAIALLKDDHRQAERLFSEFEAADDARKEEIIAQACQALIIHTLLEERVFYPAARQPSTDDKLSEAQVEHDAAKVLIMELLKGDRGDVYRKAKFKVLAEEIKHHVKEEEAPDGVFASAQKAGVNTAALAERLTNLKQQLQQMAVSGRLPDPEPASFRCVGEPPNQERTMPTERDENGRFMSDDDGRSRSRGRDYDDDRGYRSRGSSDRERDSRGRFASDDDDERGGRGSAGRDRDTQGRFARDDDDRGRGGWFGDSEGHSEASRRGWDEREDGSRGRASRDDDDDRRYRSRGRNEEDDRFNRGRGGGDRNQGGWFGDSEGHAEASRRGWENSDHGRSGWYGDSRGHAEASRRGWENSDHGRSGWYGDPAGHSEASRRGWDEREGGRNSSRSDSRGASSRGRDEDDGRGGRRSGGRGQGGWSGDSEGHAEAARRGWENRR